VPISEARIMLHNQAMHWIRVKSDEEYLLGKMSSVQSDFLDFLGIMHHTESGKMYIAMENVNLLLELLLEFRFP
jgi:hypothetical protein